MPIAECFVSASALNSAAHGSDPVKIWSQFSEESGEEMTVTLVKREQQYGKAYPIVAHLYLPSTCPKEKANRLKLGLANALSTHFSKPVSNVFVLVRTIESGEVVKDGTIQDW